MIKLPQVTLCCLTGLGYMVRPHIQALEESSRFIEFGEVKYIQLKSIKNIESWNRAVIYELPRHITTEFCLFIHSDGYVSDPASWDSDWLNYDFCGSPWPLPMDDYSYRVGDRIIRVGNSVSLRSKKLMDLVATRPMEFHYGNNNEDGQICVWEREWLESQGCKFLPFEKALRFGKEHELPEHQGKTFVFHQV